MVRKKKSNTIAKKNIWSLISVKQLTAAIASLGNRVSQLDDETWRLNSETELATSLWAQVIEKLLINRDEESDVGHKEKQKFEIGHNEKFRQSLYSVWRLKRQNIRILVEEESKKIRMNGDDGENNGAEGISFTKKNIPSLLPDPSLPLPQKPNTRTNNSKNMDDNATENSVIFDEISISLTPSEWKAAFSCTSQKMRDGWTTIFYNKLISCGVTCAVGFRKSHIKKGKRKRNCKSFWCRATCTNTECHRSFFIVLKNQPGVNASALFLVNMFGIVNHDAKNVKMARQLSGEERDRVGK
jgi:hypothetical protein